MARCCSAPIPTLRSIPRVSVPRCPPPLRLAQPRARALLQRPLLARARAAAPRGSPRGGRAGARAPPPPGRGGGRRRLGARRDRRRLLLDIADRAGLDGLAD